MEPHDGGVSDDVPIPEPPGKKAQHDLPHPQTPRDLTGERNSQAPNPHQSNGHLTGDSPIAGYFNLYKWHPFTELFCVIAEWFEPGTNSDIEQRAEFAKKYPKTFKRAMFLDFVLLFLVVVALLAALVFIALRTVGVEIEVIRIYLPWFGQPEN